jgi:hypothetical protein
MRSLVCIAFPFVLIELLLSIASYRHRQESAPVAHCLSLSALSPEMAQHVLYGCMRCFPSLHALTSNSKFLFAAVFASSLFVLEQNNA